MPAPKFVHLRVHTAYSLSEGAIQVPKLIHKLHDMGIGAFALTDTANMFGGKAISKYAKEEGIKPILGCQFYLRNPDADDVLKSKGKIIEPDKIVLLCMNAKGYANIMKLMKRAYLDNPSNLEKAQIKLSDLEELNEGLICLTGGVEGQIGRLLLEGRAQEAEELTVKLQVLSEALEKNDPAIIRDVLHQIIPTFHEPEEVNRDLSRIVGEGQDVKLGTKVPV